MKTLQYNFTTPKQSERLLRLGVPANSADCHYLSLGKNTFNFGSPHYNYKPYSSLSEVDFCELYTLYPCWSVGRLIEIYLTCALECDPYDDFYTETPSLHLMAFDKDRLIEEVIEIMSEDEMDFSKLED